jgi:hypothetical protein
LQKCNPWGTARASRGLRVPVEYPSTCNCSPHGGHGQVCNPVQMELSDDALHTRALNRSVPTATPQSRRGKGCSNWAHPCHICAGTGLTLATSAPGLGSPRPLLSGHLRAERARPSAGSRTAWYPVWHRAACLTRLLRLVWFCWLWVGSYPDCDTLSIRYADVVYLEKRKCSTP